MRAVVCARYGPPEALEIQELPEPIPSPDEVLIDVRAASVNFPDLLIVQNRYQFKPPLPFVPGTEAAGIVRSVGSNVEDVGPGDRVMAYTRFGAFAEAVIAPADQVVRTPAGMSDEVAAAFLVTYGTACHALIDRGAVRPDETVLVLGAAGGVGLAGIEVAKAIGARVIACASSREKLEHCRDHGADELIEYTTEDLRGRIAELTNQRGVDVVYDPVGGRYTEPALRSTAWGGRVLIIGFAGGEIPKIALNLPLLKGCAIVGVSWGELMRRDPALGRRGFARLQSWYAEGRLHPAVTSRLPLERAADALKLMDARQVIGKVVLTMGEGR